MLAGSRQFLVGFPGEIPETPPQRGRRDNSHAHFIRDHGNRHGRLAQPVGQTVHCRKNFRIRSTAHKQITQPERHTIQDRCTRRFPSELLQDGEGRQLSPKKCAVAPALPPSGQPGRSCRSDSHRLSAMPPSWPVPFRGDRFSFRLCGIRPRSDRRRIRIYACQTSCHIPQNTGSTPQSSLCRLGLGKLAARHRPLGRALQFS